MDAVKQIVRQFLFFSLFLVVISTASSVISPAYADAESESEAQSKTEVKEVRIKSPGTDLWRDIRTHNPDIPLRTQVKGLETGSLINVQGQAWRNFRMTQLVPYGFYLLAGVFIAIALFRLIRGKIKIKAGRSGKKISRFTPFQRFVHWTVAILFVILGITGAMLTFGRDGLVPIIGSEAFGAIAGVGKTLHDYLGPVFAVALLLMLFTFIKGNFFKWVDIKWFFKAGGMLGNHASAGRYNGGEKAWFWLAILGGAVVVASGLVLDFPIFDQTRSDMKLAHVIHAIGGIAILAASLGHIYMGTIAMEGSFESMKTGYCDENWAKEHHDLWYEELKKEEQEKQEEANTIKQ